jgi:hypothetical protein
MYNSADLLILFLLGTVFGAVGMLYTLAYIGRKAQR